MEDERRELRSWSIEPRDRRVHAVSPMHLHEGRLLNSLLHEAHNISASNSKINSSQANGSEQEKLEDAQLQEMLDKYQSQVLQQQQRLNKNPNHEIIRSFGSSCSSMPPQMPATSHSQPCLINVAEQANDPLGGDSGASYALASSSYEPLESTASLKAKLATTHKLLTTLKDENNALKQQTDFLKKKTSRLQQLEAAYETIEREYENLISQKEKQDTLEKAARINMEKQIARYAAENEILLEQLDELRQRMKVDPQTDQINKLNLILNELIPQNKELLRCKERQKMDIEALEVTLKDQRGHIQILEKALSNAQEKVWRKEKEVEELSGGAERAAALQRAIEKSIVDKQKREEEWSRERAQLEMENAQLKMQIAKESVSVGVKKGAPTRSPDCEETVAKLKKALHAKDDRIMQLEKNIIELEAKFHEEMQRNKMAIATQSDTLSVKLKKMEEEKSEKDRKIAELTEEKERLAVKLEDERKNSDSRTNLLEREMERIRSGDDRRFREDMARMEQMRLKIADRRCFTADRVRCRLNHGRTSSGSRAGGPQSHTRTHSASALLSTDASVGGVATSPSDLPLDLSNGSSSPSKSSSLLHSTSYNNNDSALMSECSPSEQLYKASISSRYSRPVASRYDVSFSDNESVVSRYSTKVGEKYAKQYDTSSLADRKMNPSGCAKDGGEQVWNV